MRAFKTGSTVLANVRLGIQKVPSWQKVTYHAPSGGLHLVHFADQSRAVSDNDIRDFVPIAEGAVEDFHKEHFEALCDTIQRAAEHLLTLKQSMSLFIKEEVLYLWYNEISVQAEVVRQDIDGVVTEVPGWGVSIWRYHVGDRENPPDSSETHFGHELDNFRAAQMVIRAVQEVEAASYWEGEGMRLMEAEAAIES